MLSISAKKFHKNEILCVSLVFVQNYSYLYSYRYTKLLLVEKEVITVVLRFFIDRHIVFFRMYRESSILYCTGMTSKNQKSQHDSKLKKYPTSHGRAIYLIIILSYLNFPSSLYSYNFRVISIFVSYIETTH